MADRDRARDLSVVIVALAAIVVALAAALVAVRRHHDDTARRDRAALDRLGPASDGPPRGLPISRAAFDADVRSVEVAGPVTGLHTLRLPAAPAISIVSSATDAAGGALGRGTLHIGAGQVTFAADDLVVNTRLRIQADGAHTSAPLFLRANGPVTVTAAQLGFVAASPSGDGAAAALTGPVRVELGGSATAIVAVDVAVADLPDQLHLSSNEADLSWAGRGFLAVGGAPVMRAEYLGLRAQDLDVLVQRGSGTFTVAGRARALQAFADGVPQLRTTARIDVVRLDRRVGIFTSHPAFTWVPRNLGGTYDMAILRVRPGNDVSRGVRLGLLPMPPMFGGEAHPPVGGVTDGLHGGGAIDSLIARHGDDERDVGYDAPPGSHLVLVVEGNFATITVDVVVPP